MRGILAASFKAGISFIASQSQLDRGFTTSAMSLASDCMAGPCNLRMAPGNAARMSPKAHFARAVPLALTSISKYRWDVMQRLPTRLALVPVLIGAELTKSAPHTFVVPSPSLSGSARAVRGSVAVKAEKKEMMMWEALREGLDEEMERDPLVCMMGEDVGHYGGSYKVSYGLHKKYGDMRLLDTPICENGFMGMGVGAAMTGLRPIVEGMNMGFLLLAFNQISNNCGMLHYTSGGQYKVPMVIRGPGGVGRQLGAEHSQRLESYFQSIPGVQLVAVSTTKNAKALLKAAIRSDNPIIFFEHVLLYNVKGVPEGPDHVQCLEKAVCAARSPPRTCRLPPATPPPRTPSPPPPPPPAIAPLQEMVREGTDVSIFCYSRMRYVVMQAVAVLEKEGYSPEVVDLISLKPFDMETITKSVKKTRRWVSARQHHAAQQPLAAANLSWPLLMRL